MPDAAPVSCRRLYIGHFEAVNELYIIRRKREFHEQPYENENIQASQ